jgi:hypothetical protein
MAMRGLAPGGKINFANRHRPFSAHLLSQGEHCAELGLTLRNAIACFPCLCQRVHPHNRFPFSLRNEIERLCATA